MLKINDLKFMSHKLKTNEDVNKWINLISSKENMEKFKQNIGFLKNKLKREIKIYKVLTGAAGLTLMALTLILASGIFIGIVSPFIKSLLLLFLIGAVFFNAIKAEKLTEDLIYLNLLQEYLMPIKQENQTEIKQMLNWVSETESCKCYHKDVLNSKRDFLMADYEIMRYLKRKSAIKNFSLESLYLRKESCEKEKSLENFI